MRKVPDTLGRRERAKEDKRRRILAAASELFAARGVGGVTTQQIADRADVAVGTLFLYASTKAELLIMVQNEKFAAAIELGLTAEAVAERSGATREEAVLALIRPVVTCIRDQLENGRTYLHELIFGDPSEPHRREGLTLSAKLEGGIARTLTREEWMSTATAATLSRVITAIIHVSTTAHAHRTTTEVVDDIGAQIHAILLSQTPGA